jgi:hypothetical protein
MLPTAHDLDDPDGFVHHEQLDFSELDKMLGEAAKGPRKPADDKGEETGATGDSDGKDDTDQ